MKIKETSCLLLREDNNLSEGHRSIPAPVRVAFFRLSALHMEKDAPCNCQQKSEYLGYYAFFAICFAAAIGNVAFATSVLATKKLRTFPSILLLSNSILDFLVTSIIIPSRIHFWILDDCWSAGHRMCQIGISSGDYCVAVGAAHAAVIATERHIRLFRPSFYKKHMKKFVVTGILLCWTLPTIFTFFKALIPSAFGYYPYDFDNNNDTCRYLMHMPCNCILCVGMTFNIIHIIGQAVFPLLIAVLVYGHFVVVIYRRIKLARNIRLTLESTSRRSNSLQSTPPSPSGTASELFKSNEFRSIRMFLIILVVLVVCAMPNVINHLIQISRGNESLRDLEEKIMSGHHVLTSTCDTSVTRFPQPLLMWCTSVLNPVLLFTFNRNYCLSLKNVILRLQTSICGKPKEAGLEDFSIPSSNRWNRIVYLGERLEILE